MALAVHRTGVIFRKCDMSNHRPETVKQCVSGTCQHTCPEDDVENATTPGRCVTGTTASSLRSRSWTRYATARQLRLGPQAGPGLPAQTHRGQAVGRHHVRQPWAYRQAELR